MSMRNECPLPSCKTLRTIVLAFVAGAVCSTLVHCAILKKNKNDGIPSLHSNQVSKTWASADYELYCFRRTSDGIRRFAVVNFGEIGHFAEHWILDAAIQSTDFSDIISHVQKLGTDSRVTFCCSLSGRKNGLEYDKFTVEEIVDFTHKIENSRSDIKISVH